MYFKFDSDENIHGESVKKGETAEAIAEHITEKQWAQPTPKESNNRPQIINEDLGIEIREFTTVEVNCFINKEKK